MELFALSDKFAQDVEALRSSSNSGILTRIAKNSLPHLDDGDFEIQSAMATANKSCGSWREKRAYVGRGGRKSG